MTQQEFKAWFDGYTEHIDGLPNEAQWARIKGQADAIGSSQMHPSDYREAMMRFQGIMTRNAKS